MKTNEGTMNSDSHRATAVYRRFIAAVAVLFASGQVSTHAEVPQYGAVPAVTVHSLDDCDQDHLATLALRACSTILKNADIDEDTRVKVYILRGRAWMSEQEPAEAISDFTLALELQPENAEALERRAKAHTRMRAYDLAAADWGSLLRLKPENNAAQLNLAMSRLAAGKHEEAIAGFGKALEMDSNNVEAYVGRGNAHVLIGEKNKALEDFDAALAIDSLSVTALIAKAEAAERWGEPKLAIENYLAAVKSNGMLLKPRMALQRLGVETPTPP